jgi:hypothetical protein
MGKDLGSSSLPIIYPQSFAGRMLQGVLLKSNENFF